MNDIDQDEERKFIVEGIAKKLGISVSEYLKDIEYKSTNSYHELEYPSHFEIIDGKKYQKVSIDFKIRDFDDYTFIENIQDLDIFIDTLPLEVKEDLRKSNPNKLFGKYSHIYTVQLSIKTLVPYLEEKGVNCSYFMDCMNLTERALCTKIKEKDKHRIYFIDYEPFNSLLTEEILSLSNPEDPIKNKLNLLKTKEGEFIKQYISERGICDWVIPISHEEAIALINK